MSSGDQDEQEDELLALCSIFGPEEFFRNEKEPAGEIRVSAELPADFTVALREGETVRQYEISFLPPLLLTFELPADYPSSSPPCFTLTCSWLTHLQLSALGAQLTDLYRATGGAVVLFSWVQFLREDALRHLDIDTVLELPSDEHSARHRSQDSHNLSETKTSEAAESPSASDGSSSADSLGAVASRRDTLPSHDHKVSQNDLNSGFSNGSDQTAQALDAREAEQAVQTLEPNPDRQRDLSPAGGKSKHLTFADSAQIGPEDFLNQGDVSASLMRPPGPAGELDQSGQGAASQPVHRRESSQKKEQTLSGLSLTPSQTLLCQLLIYDAAQKQEAFATTEFQCGVCLVGWPGSQCVQLPECGHVFCQTCLAGFCKVQIAEGNVRGVTCPQADCTASPTPAQVKSLIGEELFSRYDRLLLQSTLDLMPDVTYCPRPSCSLPVILEKSSTAAICSVCNFAFCVTCRKTYHGTADCQAKPNMKKDTEDGLDYAALPQSQEGMTALWKDYTSGSKGRRCFLQSRYGRRVFQYTMLDFLSEEWIALNSKKCPNCLSRIQKDGGCHIMTCSQCRHVFSWSSVTRSPASVPGGHFQ